MKNYTLVFIVPLFVFLLACSNNTRIETPNDNSEIVTSTITCPECGHKKTEIMPTDACQIKYNCEKCNTELGPKDGDCCVFCTYGDHKCPSMQ